MRAAGLNADAHSARLDRAALDAAIREQGAAFQQAVTQGHEHLFADAALFVSDSQLQQMQEVIAAVEQVVKLPGWMNDESVEGMHSTLGVFYGYDFHLNAQGAHLIEINTNAGGVFLNALLLESQREIDLPGKVAAVEDPGQVFLDMFLHEWRLERGAAPLQTIAIVDERPEEQYLYPEFLLVKDLFGRAGITAHIVDPSALQSRDEGLYLDGCKVDLVYNRLTDFSLQQYPHLRSAYEKHKVVLTPAPVHYHRYADKRKLVLLSDDAWLRAANVPQASMDALLQGIPQTISVRGEDAEHWWAERKHWFFKPVNGYGGKGAYRGEKLTRRVFEEIMQADYVAQKMAAPGERAIFTEAGAGQLLKCDVRCYVYEGQIQLVAARLYQGQTTNFRTPGGGFALVRVVE